MLVLPPGEGIAIRPQMSNDERGGVLWVAGTSKGRFGTQKRHGTARCMTALGGGGGGYLSRVSLHLRAVSHIRKATPEIDHHALQLGVTNTKTRGKSDMVRCLQFSCEC